MERPPVILHMDVHCLGCAKKIHKAIKDQYGVKNVWASPETGLVIVAGSANAMVLKLQIESKISNRLVTIVCDGTEVPDAWQMAHPHAPPPEGYPPYVGMVHLGLPSSDYTGGQPAPPYPYGNPAANWVPAQAQHQLQYLPGETVHARQYTHNETPACFKDENRTGCCSAQ